MKISMPTRIDPADISKKKQGDRKEEKLEILRRRIPFLDRVLGRKTGGA